MNTFKINELPELVKEKRIELSRAKDELWTDIYKKPLLYGLSYLTEDQKSDFLMWMSGSFTDIISNFKQGKIEFFFYVRKCLKKGLYTWLRRRLKQIASEKCLYDQIMLDYEFRENTSADAFPQEKMQGIKKTLHTFSRKQQEIIKTFIHILACRAVNELEEDTINNISDFLEIDRNAFAREMDELKAVTEKKADGRKKIIERRNKAYYYHKKFLYELSQLDKSSVSYAIIFEKLLAQTANWKKINEALHARHSQSPTTIEIAKTTGIKQRQVSFYLNHQKKRKTLLPFIDFPELPGENHGEK